MYNINSKVDKPDIQYMHEKAVKMMRDGIVLNDVEEMYNKFLGIQQELRENIQNEYGIVNPNSPQQICRYMENLDSLEVYEIAYIDGRWSSNRDVMEELVELGYKFAEDILAYRKAKKYAESINSMLKAVNNRTGAVHPTVSLGKTNRINYSNPALMNIPKKLLWYVVAPRREGNYLYSVDIKNQEPSMLINLLQIEELKEALVSPLGLYETLFTKVFSQRTKLTVYVTQDEESRVVPATEMSESVTIPPVYYTPIKPSVSSVYYNNEKVKLIEVCNTITRLGEQPLLPEKVSVETVKGNVYEVDVVWDEIKDRQLKSTGIVEIEGELTGLEIRCVGVIRNEFKMAWNAMTYGASSFGVKKMCKHIDGDVVYKYFSKIQAFREYKSNCRKLADKGIQEINTFFGTKLYAGEPNRNRLQRVLMDLPIQGTGADILALLLKHFDEEVESRKLTGLLDIYYPRHDELIIEVNGNWANTVGDDKVKETLRDILEHKIDDWVPFKVDISRVDVEPLNILDDGGEDIFES